MVISAEVERNKIYLMESVNIAFESSTASKNIAKFFQDQTRLNLWKFRLHKRKNT